MYEFFSDNARKALWFADEIAREFHCQYISREHLFLGMLKEESLSPLFKRLGIDPQALRIELQRLIPVGHPLTVTGKLPLTPHVKTIFAQAVSTARESGSKCVEMEHLLIALLKAPEDLVAQVLNKLGVTYELVEKALQALAIDTPTGVVSGAPILEEEVMICDLSPERMGEIALLYFQARVRSEGMHLLGPEDFRKRVAYMAEVTGISHGEAFMFVQTLAREFLEKVYPGRKELESLPVLPIGLL